MTRTRVGLAAGLGLIWIQFAAAQQSPTQQAKDKAPDRGAAYYHYSLSHLYTELAGAYNNRSEYLNQAIDNLRLAMKADPAARFLAEELSDLYIQGGRLKEGVTEAEAALRENPEDLNARRLLGRIYMRLIGDPQQGRVNDNMLQRATEQFLKITEKDPQDTEAWLTLGRLHKIGQNSVESEKAFQKALALEPDNEDALTGLALVYSDLGDSRRASELLKRVSEKSPNLRTFMALAGSYEQMKEYALAAETLRKAMELAPDNPDLKRALAQSLLYSDKYDESLKLYRELVAEDAKDVQSWVRISQIHRERKNFEEARKAINEAKKLEPDNLEIVFSEVGIYEAEGKMGEAIAGMKSVLESTAKKSYSASEKANRAILLERLGLMQRNHEQYADAVATFRELGTLDEKNGARASAQVIDTWRQARDFTKATEESEAAKKKYPDERIVTLVRGSLLADMGHGAEAAAEVKKLLGKKETDRETYLTLAQLYEKSKNFGEMGKALDEAEKLSNTPDEKEPVLFMRGALYEKQKNFERSEAEFRKVLDLNPKSASALNYLGYMLADRNVRLNEALDMIKRAVDQEPDNGAFLDSLGWVYFRLGRLDEAADYLKRAVQQSQKDPTVNDHLGDVYMKQGNLKEAIEQWEISLRLWNALPAPDIDQAEVAKIQKKLESGRVRQAKEQTPRKNQQ
ncbi:MAG TPA: tetratricopeptide repeat protein [Bryobacteraceae bacterium]|nr:tetratricopeptide repeat protein [Bryobacteraceae bacterium]